jgi:hypothetical protein
VQHNGFEYRCEDDSDRDRRRANHSAVLLSTGQVISIDHTGYEAMSKEAFRAHVELGFPPRRQGQVVPWTNKTITAEYWSDHG